MPVLKEVFLIITIDLRTNELFQKKRLLWLCEEPKNMIGIVVELTTWTYIERGSSPILTKLCNYSVIPKF